jgi:hypothetical protein
MDRAGTFSRTKSNVIFCRRMVRDEHKRNLCIAAGRLGGNPTLKGKSKGTPKGGSKGTSDGRLSPVNKRNPTPSSSTSFADADPPLQTVLDISEKQNPEPFDLEDWFERIYACHPRKGHKIPAQQYLGTHPSIMDARWRVKFEDSHAKWCGCEDWQWKGGVKAPYLFEFLRDETYNYEPPKSKDGDSRPAKQSVWQEAV